MYETIIPATTITCDNALTLEYADDGWWHIEEKCYREMVWHIGTVDWYCEGFDTAVRMMALLAAHPSEVG